MIVEWLVGIGVTVSEWIASLFPPWEAPDFLVNADDSINSIVGNLNGVGVWADWLFILLVVSTVVSLWVISFGIKLARAIASHVPFFGGSG